MGKFSATPRECQKQKSNGWVRMRFVRCQHIPVSGSRIYLLYRTPTFCPAIRTIVLGCALCEWANNLSLSIFIFDR